jgi:hypothetical protein
MNLKKGHKVRVPFDQKGIVTKIETEKPWGNMIHVKITDATLHDKGEIVEFKPTDVRPDQEETFDSRIKGKELGIVVLDRDEFGEPRKTFHIITLDRAQEIVNLLQKNIKKLQDER